jgi:hypothetical protein
MENLKFYRGRDLNFRAFAKAMWPLIIPSFILPCVNIYRDLQNPAEHVTDLRFYVGVLLFVVAVISYRLIDSYFKKKLNKIAFELTENGIIDISGKRIIPWLEIYNLEYKGGMLAVMLNDNDAFKAKTVWQRAGQWLNKLFYGTPVIISLNYVRGDGFDNYNLIYDYMEALEKLHAGEDSINA